MGWSWFRPVTIRSVLGCVLGWTGLEHDSHIQVFYRERRHFNDTALTWSNTVNGWTSKYLKFLAESVYISQPVNVNMGPVSFKCFSGSQHRRWWEFGMKRVDESIPPCQGMCFLCVWVHVSAGGREAVIHSELHFVCEENWFWCPEGVQAASCCVCCNLGDDIPPTDFFQGFLRPETRYSVRELWLSRTLYENLKNSAEKLHTHLTMAVTVFNDPDKRLKESCLHLQLPPKCTSVCGW